MVQVRALYLGCRGEVVDERQVEGENEVAAIRALADYVAGVCVELWVGQERRVRVIFDGERSGLGRVRPAEPRTWR